MRLKSYKFRLYPTKEQKVLLSKTFGCVRYVYNRALAIKSALYQNEKKGISVFSLMKEITKWKDCEETVWLKEVNSQALQSSLHNLDMAYTKFFKEKKGFPKFKNKFDKQSFSNPQNTEINWENNRVYIPKFKNGIKVVLDRQFEGKIKTSTVSKTKTGKYFISILVEENIENIIKSEPIEEKTLGIDLGIKTYATFSDGIKIENPRHLQKKIKKLRRACRQHSRKKKGSKNREKSRKKLAKVYEDVTNVRVDFIHKLTTSIVKNQNYTSIAIEDLNISEMMQKSKKNKLSKHIADAAWGEFRRQLIYKCEWYGKNLLTIGRFEPSSKMCSCGNINNDLTLKDRSWTCCACGLTHDRDTLAAQNIKRFAFCTQNTYKDSNNSSTNKISVSQELREPGRKTKKPLDHGVSCGMKKEASTALA